MKDRNKFMAVGLLFFFFLTGASYTNNGIKVGIIDLQKIIEVSDAGKAAQLEINLYGKLMEADLKKKCTEIEEIEKMIERESLAKNQKPIEEKQREVRIKTGDIKDLKKRYIEDIKARENRIISQTQKEIVDVVQNRAKKDGYTIIIEKRAGGVIYAPSSMDITDPVIRDYNIKFSNSFSKKTINMVKADFINQ